jgi:glycosyltransferase involved in cell wall biosynthesis
MGLDGFGFNLFGFLTGHFGLGITARHYLRMLREAGQPVCPVDVLAHSGRSVPDPTFPERLATLDDPTPYPVNLFFMNPGDLARVIGLGAPAIRSRGRINACLPFWELSELPAEWVSTLEAFDLVLAGSRFNYDCFARALSEPMVGYVPHPLYIDGYSRPDRARWGLCPNSTVFLTSFDMASDINRKNPMAAVEAFQHAFQSDAPVSLMIKVHNTHLDDSYPEHVDRLAEIASADCRILVMDQALSYADVLSLYSSCDVYVSLHRAEGLGLCLLETMSMGKPVIATAWSGNMEFMTDDNSCPVRFSFVPVCGSTQAAYRRENISPESRWAEPDVGHAARWMRELAANPELRRRIGTRAAADVAERQARIGPDALLGAVRACHSLNGRADSSPSRPTAQQPSEVAARRLA